MFNSFTTKFKSFLFSPSTGNSRKRKRPADESDDQDCEIIEVKRAKIPKEQPQLGYNFFAKMADWVRNKTKWDHMFDFKPKQESGKRNGQLRQEDTTNHDRGRPGKHNGNGISSQNVVNQGQGRTYMKGHRRPGHGSSYNNGEQADRSHGNGIPVVNGDGRETPPDISQSQTSKRPSRKTYASVVKSSTNEQKELNGTSISTQTNNQYSCMTQRSMFNKKPDVHFTANETVRLDEKERYKMLLQQYTTVPLRTSQVEQDRTQDNWPALEASRSYRKDETLLGSRKNQYITKIDISQSKDVPRHRMMPKYVQQTPGSSFLRRHISPLDMIKSASQGTSRIQSPTSIPHRPLLESTRVIPESHEETIVSPEKTEQVISAHGESDRSQRNTTTSASDYRNSQYLSENWAADLLTKYNSAARERNRKIAETEIRAKLYEERRKGREDDLERRLRQQMQIYEKEPPVIEDLPIQEIESEEEEEKEEVLPEITSEMDDVINRALRGQPAGEVLVEGYRLQITRADIATLAGLNWLNDEVINFYMNMLMERGEKDNYSKCYAFNTFFYPKIMSGGHSTVRRWTKKVDIFSYNYIIIPVHLGMHWCLCIVDFKKKSIQYYDSMGGNNVKCLNAVKQYLCDESKDKKNQPFDLKDWNTEIVEDIPQQMNGSDCGMFACKFADYITRGAKITFTQQHMSYFRRRMVYEIVKKKLLQ